MSIGIILFSLLIISGIWFFWEFFSFLFRTSNFINNTTRKVFETKEKDVSEDGIQRDENGDYVIEPEFKKEKTPDIQKYIYIFVGVIVVLFFLPVIIRLFFAFFPFIIILFFLFKDKIIKFLDDLFK